MWLGWAVGSAMAMLPWPFAASEWLRQRGGRRAVAALALAVAVSIFAGYPQITAVALLVTGAWALVRAPATRRPWSFLGAWASGAVIGGALAAVQILPFLEYLGESAVYAYRAQWMPVMAAPPRSALALLMPGYFGSATGRDYWGYFNPNEIAANDGEHYGVVGMQERTNQAGGHLSITTHPGGGTAVEVVIPVASAK